MIELPFPPSSLSGHNNGSWYDKREDVRKHREWAKNATLAADPWVPEEGDIAVHMSFFPPNLRGDRLNYVIRAKPYFDGIADALKVNDKRFLPRFYFCAVEKPGRVEVRFGKPL